MAHAAQDPDLCQLADVKAWLAIPPSSTDADDLLQRLIAAASAGIRNYLNRDRLEDTYVETRTGTGTGMMVLYNQPVSLVFGVTILGRSIPPSTTAWGAGFRYDEQAVYLTGGVFVRKPPMAIEIKYVAGYDTEDLPVDIADACIKWVGLRFKERERIGHVSKSIQGETIAYTQKDMPDDVARVLGNYKRVNLG